MKSNDLNLDEKEKAIAFCKEEDRERYLFLLTGESIIVRSLNLYYDSNKNNEKFFHTENFTPTDSVPNPLIKLVNQLIEIKFEQKELIDRIENEKNLMNYGKRNG